MADCIYGLILNLQGNSMPEYWLPLASMKIGANQTFGSHFHVREIGLQCELVSAYCHVL